MPVPGVGPQTARLFVIGQSAGEQEDQHNYPFWPKAPSGMELRASIAGINIDPREVYITNAIKCHPPGNRKAHVGEVAACEPWLATEIAMWSPDAGPHLIVAVGEDAARTLFPKVRGAAKLSLSELRRSESLVYAGRPVRVVLHPAALLRPGGERLRADYDADWDRIGLYLGTVTPREPYWKHYRYAVDSVGLSQAWQDMGLDNAGIIGLDTEFGWPDPLSIIGYSVSAKAGTALWVPSYVDGFKDTLDSLTNGSRTIVIHSAQADVPVIQRALGYSDDAWVWSRTFDTAIAAYVRREPMIGLKQLALSHFGMKLTKFSETFESPEEFAKLPVEDQYQYAGADADIALRLALEVYKGEFDGYLSNSGRSGMDGIHL